MSLLLVAPALAGVPLAMPVFDPATYPDLREREVVTVLLVGDSGVGAGFTPVARAAADVCFAPGRVAPCDLALFVGDNVYDEGFTAPGGPAWVESFAAPMAPFVERAKQAKFRAWIVAGNHDWGHEPEKDGELRIGAAIQTTGHPANEELGGLWQFPALSYEVPGLPDWLNLYGLDTETVVAGKGTAQIDATRASMRRSSGWDVVFGHHVPASTGGHGQSEKDDDDEAFARVLHRLRPLGLSMVLVGHDHHQEVLETGGLPVVIQGNSSKGREVGASKYTPCSRWVRGGKEARGFAIVTFREDEATVEFFDGAGAPVHTASWRREGLAARGRVGTCPA